MAEVVARIQRSMKAFDNLHCLRFFPLIWILALLLSASLLACDSNVPTTTQPITLMPTSIPAPTVVPTPTPTHTPTLTPHPNANTHADICANRHAQAVTYPGAIADAQRSR